jgi:predicted component of type VI protein secretion system
MPPHHQASNDASRMNAREMFGLSLLVPEPEVATAQLSQIKCRSLAQIISAAITEHEPLLKADCNGATVTVRERGGNSVMRFTVEPGK